MDGTDYAVSLSICHAIEERERQELARPAIRPRVGVSIHLQVLQAGLAMAGDGVVQTSLDVCAREMLAQFLSPGSTDDEKMPDVITIAHNRKLKWQPC